MRLILIFTFLISSLFTLSASAFSPKNKKGCFAVQCKTKRVNIGSGLFQNKKLQFESCQRNIQMVAQRECSKHGLSVAVITASK